jgi:exosortase family protein XrtF
VLNVLGYQATIEPKDNLPVLKLNVEGVYLAQIIEGCNALSVIILFIAFVVAFAAGFKKTIMFLLAGSVLIYGINILRIVILSIALYEYPQYEEILHGVVFPAIIYGIVFLLWVLWVRQLKPEIPQAHA